MKSILGGMESLCLESVEIRYSMGNICLINCSQKLWKGSDVIWWGAIAFPSLKESSSFMRF